MNFIKYKHIIAIFIIGFIINLFGALQKILHTPIANMMFTIAFCIMATSGLVAVITAAPSGPTIGQPTR